MPRQGQPSSVSIDGHRYKVLDYKVEDLRALASQFRTGVLSPSDRANEFVSHYDTWHVGFGLGEMRDSKDVGRYHYSKGVDPRTRGQLILGPQISTSTYFDPTTAEAKVQYIEFNSLSFAIGARYCHKWDNATQKWLTDKDFGATSACVKNCADVFAGYLVVGCADAVDFWRRDTSGAWTQPAAGVKITLCKAVGSNLWRIFNKNQLSSNTGDFTTWTAALTIGYSYTTATALVDYSGIPHTLKPEGLFDYDGTTIHNRLPEMSSRLSPTNGQGAKPARGQIYVPVGPSLWTYTVQAVSTEGKPNRTAEVLAPTQDRNSANEVRGTLVDIWPDVDYLYGIMAAVSGNYYLMAQDYNPNDGQGWHQVQILGQTAITSLGRFQDATGNPRLWYSEGTNIKFVLLPNNAVNPWVDTNYRYGLTGDIYMSQEFDTFPEATKAELSVKFECQNTLAGLRYVDVAYSIDGGAEQSLRRVDTDGLQILYFSTATFGRRISFHLKLTTNDPTQTVRVLPWSRHYQIRFERKRRWTMNAQIGRHVSAEIPQDAKKAIANLTTSRDNVGTVTYIDPFGTSWSVFIEELGEAQHLYGSSPEDDFWICPIGLLEWKSGLGAFYYNDATNPIAIDPRSIYDNAASPAFYS